MQSDLKEVLRDYQDCHLKISKDPLKESDLKRRCLTLKQFYSYKCYSNAASCEILEEDLTDYFDSVDNRSDFETTPVASNFKNDTSSWKSCLLLKGLKLDDLLNKSECQNQKYQGCSKFDSNCLKIENGFKPKEIVKSTDIRHEPKINESLKNVDVSNRLQGFAPEKKFESQRPPIKRNFQNQFKNQDTNIYSYQNGRKFNKKDNEEPENMNQYFFTAAEQLKLEQNKKTNEGNYLPKKTLGGKRPVANKFVPPIKRDDVKDDGDNEKKLEENNEELDERLKNIDPKMIKLITSEIMDQGSKISWDDIAGLHFAKSTIQEIVVWPMLRPDIFTGLRRPPKGILLFGPPGTGKTLIGKCIASQSNSTFFSISASSLTSKWIGDGEKMVRALFSVARVHQPSVVFIDEIDSLLSQRSDTEHESSRRIKTEFLVQLDGAATGEEDRILVIGATNRPQELDEAARRRLVKRLYIPLPDFEARVQLVSNLMKNERHTLSSDDITEISKLTDGYSGADVKNVCQEASLGPIRSIGPNLMFNISPEQVRPVDLNDFKTALKRVRSSVSSQDLAQYVVWDQTFGSGGTMS